MVEIEELFDELDTLCKLKNKIGKEYKPKFGDEDWIEYQRSYDNLIRNMPKTEEAFIDFIEDIQSYYEDLEVSLKKEKGEKEELIESMKRLTKRYE